MVTSCHTYEHILPGDYQTAHACVCNSKNTQLEEFEVMTTQLAAQAVHIHATLLGAQY